MNPILAMTLRPILRRRNAKQLAIPAPQGIRAGQFVTIGGIEQWITIRGQDRDNPLLLIVHGGPGSPYTPFNSWLAAWEEDFTIVQWEQRGAGKTFKRNGADGCGRLTIERLAQDGVEVAEYVLTRLGKPKLILLGSSIGSIIGAVMAKQRPDLFYAYIGTEQNGLPDAFNRPYAMTKEALARAGDKKGLAFLAAMGSDRTRWTRQQFETMNKLAVKVSSKLSGVPNMVYDLMLPALMFDPSLTMSDIRTIQRGMDFSMGQLFEELTSFDLGRYGYDFAVPFFIFQGESDILTPVDSAKDYFDRLQAPHKEFVLIKHAGHLAEFANPAQFLQELRDRVHPLAGY